MGLWWWQSSVWRQSLFRKALLSVPPPLSSTLRFPDVPGHPQAPHCTPTSHDHGPGPRAPPFPRDPESRATKPWGGPPASQQDARHQAPFLPSSVLPLSSSSPACTPRAACEPGPVLQKARRSYFVTPTEPEEAAAPRGRATGRRSIRSHPFPPGLRDAGLMWSPGAHCPRPRLAPLKHPPRHPSTLPARALGIWAPTAGVKQIGWGSLHCPAGPRASFLPEPPSCQLGSHGVALDPGRGSGDLRGTAHTPLPALEASPAHLAKEPGPEAAQRAEGRPFSPQLTSGTERQL